MGEKIIPFLFTSIFLYYNIKILISDIRHKIIPNKYLKVIFVMGIIYFVYNLIGSSVNQACYSIGVLFATISICFGLYYYGVWSAGDAKYVITLFFFIPNTNIIVFIGNIGMLITLYLLGYFIYFYTVKCLKKNYFKTLLQNIRYDIQEKIKFFLMGKNKQEVSKLIIGFLLIFTIIRIGKEYLSEYIKTIFPTLIDTHGIYVLLLGGFLVLWTLHFISKIFFYIKKRYIGKYRHIEYYILAGLLLSLIIFSLYEFRIDPIGIKLLFWKVLTIYLLIFFVVKLIKYTFYVTFQLGEQAFIPLTLLKKGDIVDKTFLIKLFGTQKCLGYMEDGGLLTPNPKEYFLKMKNPIREEELETIRKVFQITNDYHRNEPYFSEVTNIKVLKTFAFGGYIFTGFIITFLYNDLLIKTTIYFITKKLFNL